METLSTAILMIILVTIAIALGALVVAIFKSFTSLPIVPSSTPNLDRMDQGDYHSGPEGYSPNTAYPETQYGSGFDEDASWNEDEHNR